jgi:hypothetical protein
VRVSPSHAEGYIEAVMIGPEYLVGLIANSIGVAIPQDGQQRTDLADHPPALGQLQRNRTLEEASAERNHHEPGRCGIGHHVFWKIERMEFGSEDPTDPAKTTRVLTMMLAEDY